MALWMQPSPFDPREDEEEMARAYPRMLEGFAAPASPYGIEQDAARELGSATRSQISPEVSDYVMRSSSPRMKPAAVAPENKDNSGAPAIRNAEYAVRDAEEAERDRSDPNTGLKIADAIFSGMAGKDYDTGYWQGIDQRRDQQADKAKKEAQIAELRDPNSRVSQQRRLLLTPYLRAAGLGDDEISRLSAADLEGFDLSRAVGYADDLAARREAQKLRADRFAAEQAKEAEKKRLAAEAADPNSETSKRYREFALQVMPDLADKIEGRSKAELENNPYIRGAIQMATQEERSQDSLALEEERQRNRQQMAGVREKYAIGREGRAEERALGREGRAEARTQLHRGEDFRKWYSKEAEKDLAIANLIEQIDKAPGGAAPQGLMERFRSAFTARGIDPARVKSWQMKQMVLELWARQQTGAAISATEDQRFTVQTGLSATADQAQVEAAYDVMEDVVGAWLRTKGAARPDDAREILQAAGASPDRWLGKAPKPRVDALSRRKPHPNDNPRTGYIEPPPRDEVAPGAGPGAEAPAAKSIGKRGGKDVRAFRDATAPDGKRVRVFFYMDGSQEVVPRG